jgi:hypothetical protein
MGNSTTKGSITAEEGFVGNLIGNVTGNVTGNVVGNVTSGQADLAQTGTITGTVADGTVAGISMAPTYNAATAQTVTRHNYIKLVSPVLGGAGPAANTDAAVFWFNAAAGTHKAVDSGTTKTTPGAVTQWVKINVNGTIGYIPSYSSKTS